nr:hypothetical protein [Tanacetum cinerariifolium]
KCPVRLPYTCSLAVRVLLVTDLPDCNATIKDSPTGRLIDLAQLSIIGATKLSIPWFNDASVIRDPLPIDDVVNFPCVELLDDNQMGLLDFVKSANPFKVKIGERTLVENEVSLLAQTEDMVISHSPQTIILVDHTIEDELKANMG